ncbi:unnamed protein product [Rotaria sordida]|uniref:Uncharacterized protein n=1 Tax=Rotaria sordida TaxID=392033 RepID=A0A815C5G9_9BILA|nr:unnamed protein product [Rotaria sordida]
MYKKFRCGRLILMHDGTLKKLDLENGGGARVCHWNNKDMTLNDIHHVILNIFNMAADTQVETSLYDFKLNRLDVNQYATFYDYIYHNGLNCNSTVIYLCTNQVNNIDESKTKEKEHTITTSTSKKISKQSTISLSTTSVECKNIIDNIEQDSDECNSHNTSSEYSFINSINKLLKNIRELINQNNYDENLIQLFENISMIYGYVYLTIDSLQEYIQSLNEDVRLNRKYNITLHSTCLNNIIDICESTEILFNLNNNKFRYIEHYSIISDSFIQFYQNLKILHNQWCECVENNKKSYEGSSSFIHSIESATSTLSHLNNRSLLQHNFEINSEILNKENQENIVLLEQLLDCARNLLNSLYGSRLSTFRTMIKSIIVQIESIKSTINIDNSESLRNARKTMLSIKRRYTTKFNSDAFTSPIYRFSRPIKQAYQKTLTAICDLITSLPKYQISIVENHKNTSNTSSNSLSIANQEQLENRTSNRTHKRKSKSSHVHNHDQNRIVLFLPSERESLPQCVETENKQKVFKYE